jgi:pimeloyl-ACP methyl ester carboxylesterase
MQRLRPIMKLIAIAAIAWVAWATFLYFMQRSMMFPTRIPVPEGGGLPPDVERIWFQSTDSRVEGWFLAARGSGTWPAVIFAHGNAELIDYVYPEANDLRAMGLSVLLIEYPGYGRSTGSPSRASIGRMFVAGYDWLAGHANVDRDRIAGIGRSLGGGVITDLSVQRPLRALVLQSTFTSVAAVARGYLMPAFLARDRFDNLAAVRDFDGPILLVHGTRDDIIPYSHGERLAREAPSAELLSLECGHNDCPPDPAAYNARLAEFLERAGVTGRSPN